MPDSFSRIFQVKPVLYLAVLLSLLFSAAAEAPAGSLSQGRVESPGVGKVVSIEPVFVARVARAGDAAEPGEEEYEDTEGLDGEGLDDPFAEEGEDVGTMPDPIEPLNRAFFVFNDKVYFWVLKPAARGYGAVVPEKGRVAVKRFFANITMPIRFVNSVLQLKFEGAAVELARFAVNTTFGVAGFRDPATETWKMPPSREDTGQTFGHYGAGPGFFINLPFLGPSSLRDGIGRIGDLFLDPTAYVFAEEVIAGVGVEAYEMVNYTSLNINLYEDMKKESLDPYSFIRDAYHQYRENLVKE